MRTQTLSYMRGRAAWLADIVTPSTNTFITISDANATINEGVSELFNLCLEAAGVSAFEKTTTITLLPNTTDYALPNDFYELVGVSNWLDASGTIRVPLTRYSMGDEPFLQSSPPGNFGEAFRFRELGKSSVGGADPGGIRFLPAPSTSNRVVLTYVYAPPTLVGDGDMLDGFGGFEDYAIVFAAKRFATKEENYELADRLGAELERIKGNVLANMRSRDATMAPRVNMTRTELPRNFRRGRRW